MTTHAYLAALGLAATLFTAGSAHAADEHGHDHGDAAPASAGLALPRFAAVSEAFELVGVLDGTQLKLYLDHFADNSPVKGAQIDFEIGGAKVKLEPRAEGEFEGTLAVAPRPGVLPITVTIIAGAQNDLLAGELDIHDAALGDEGDHSHWWKGIAIWVAGGLVAFGLLAWGGLRLRAARRSDVGGAA